MKQVYDVKIVGENITFCENDWLFEFVNKENGNSFIINIPKDHEGLGTEPTGLNLVFGVGEHYK